MRQPLIYALGIAFLIALVGGCDASQNKSGADAEPAAIEEKPMPEKSAEPKTDGANSSALAADSGTSLWVMQPRGNRQCEGGGRSLQSSAAQLAENGITVQESRCAVRTDRMYPSVCGGATGDLLMHRIPSGLLDAALELGFDPAKPGTYQFGDCPKVKPGGSSAY